MKNYATLIIGSLVLFLIACGGDKNSVEAKKTALANLKKQALEISINIANLEKEIKTLGGAKADKTILASIDTIKTQVFDHYIELQGKIELNQIENQLGALKNNIDNEITQAKLNYMSSMATMQFQKKNMQLAETVYQQTKKKFETGTGSNTEMSAAQADLVTAQNNYMNALYSALIAKVDLLKATGKL